MKRGTESEAPNIDRLWAVGLILILGFAVVWRWIASGAPSGGDGAQYLAHALALAEGRPYDEIGYLYTPAMWSVGPPRYPPGLPATLAPLLALFGPFSQATLVLMHLFLFAFVCLAGAYFARESGSMVGWGVAGMVATALLLGDQADIVGSDLGFCALVWGVLLLADHPRRLSWKHSGLLTLLGSAALAYRLAAAPLLPAAGAFAILKRKQMGWAMLLPAVVWLGILLLIFQYFGPGEAPSADVAGSGSGGTARNLFPSLEGWIGAVDRRLSVYQNALSEAYLYPLPWKTANQAYQLGAFGVTLVGLWPWIRQRARTFAVLFAATTILMLALSPVWQARYLWVLTPFLCYGLLRGIVAIVAWAEATVLKRRARPRPALAVKFSLAVVSLAVVSAMIQPRPSHPPELETWRGVSAALAELESATPTRVASNRPRKVAWFTGISAMPVVWRDLDLFLREAEEKRVTLVVFTTAVDDPYQVDGWENWLLAYPDLFVQLAEVGPVRVFELTRYRP